MITAVTLLAVGLLAAPPLTDADRATLIAELEASQRAVVETVEKLSEAQLAYKPGPDRWSVAQCTEHLAATEPFLFDFVMRTVMTRPIASEAERAKAAGRDGDVATRMQDRTQKAQAPKEVAPTGRWTGREALLAAFKESRGKTIAYAKSTQDDLRGHISESQGGRPGADVYQWIVMISAHSRRHLAQMKEVMASPGFPTQ